MYAPTTSDEANAADGLFSTACLRLSRPALHDERERQNDPEEHLDLGVPEAVFKEARDEKGEGGGEASGGQRSMQGRLNRQPSVDPKPARQERRPDPEPGAETENSPFGGDLDRVVVQVTDRGSPCVGLAVLRIEEADISRAD